MARKVKKGKQLQEVPQHNPNRVHAPHGRSTDSPKSIGRKKKPVKDVEAPSTADADGVAEPQERRGRRRTNAEEIQKSSPISPRRTRRMKERKMHPPFPATGVQINFYLLLEQTLRGSGAMAGIHVERQPQTIHSDGGIYITTFSASTAREPALGTPEVEEATPPVYSGVDTLKRREIPLRSPEGRDKSIGKVVNNLVRARVVKNPIVKVDLSKHISNPFGRLLRLAVRDGSTEQVLEVGRRHRRALIRQMQTLLQAAPRLIVKP
jgi:hypothetical protein